MMIEKLRASKIAIEMPKEGSEVWLHITVQKVLKDDNGKVVNVIPRFGYISKPLKDIDTETYQYNDVVKGETGTISGFGIADALSTATIDFLVSKYNATLGENGDVVL